MAVTTPPSFDHEITSCRDVDAFARRSRWAFAAASLGALLLVLGAYSNSVHNSFHFDDSYSIERNIFIRDLANIPRFFTDARTFSSAPNNADYRPVVTLTLAIDYWLGGGLNPTAFHITQLLLLVAVGTLLVLFYVKLFESAGGWRWHRWVALLTATLFCVHTANTQVGNYISSRSELLSAIGVLGAFLLYLYAPRTRSRHLYLLPMIFGALAKSPAVMFAPLLLAYKLLIEEQLSIREVFSRDGWPKVRKALRASFPALALALALFLFIEAMNGPGQTYGGGGRLQYLLTQTWVWLRYERLFLVPTGLSADTDLTLFNTWRDPRVALGVLVAAAMLVGLWRASATRRLRPAAFGLAWYWLALVPASSIFPLAEVTNDHRPFFPFMGLAAAVVWWVCAHLRNRAAHITVPVQRTLARAVCAIAMLLLAAHAIGTYRRNRVWLSEETLWADVVRKSPANGRGLMNYGLSQMQHGRYALAKDLFTRAQAFAPNYAVLEVNFGIVSDALQDGLAAERHFARALALDSNYAGAHLYYARWLVEHQQAPEALPYLQKAIALSPGDADARELLMNMHAARGATSELKSLAFETLHLAGNGTMARAYATDTFPYPVTRPSYQSLFELGLRFTALRRHLEAAQAYRAALSFDPRSTDAWNNLGWSLAELGFYDDAIAAYETALRLQPDLVRAVNNLALAKDARSGVLFRRAFALQQSGHLDEAIRIYRGLLAQSPDWTNAHYNLGHALMMQGRCSEAVGEFERTLRLQSVYPAAHFHLASCLEKLGRPTDAAQHLARYEASLRAQHDTTASRGGP